jgi:hypothetical protein
MHYTSTPRTPGAPPSRSHVHTHAHARALEHSRPGARTRETASVTASVTFRNKHYM